MREFEYTFFHNILGINTRVSHFVNNYSRSWTLCVTSRTPVPVSDETFKHLFYDCQIVTGLRDKLLQKHYPQILPMNDRKKIATLVLSYIGRKTESFPVCKHFILSLFSVANEIEEKYSQIFNF